MRLQFLSLTVLVVFFETCNSSSDQDTTPINQESEAERVKLPSGPSLRPFIVDPVSKERQIVEPISHKLISDIDGKVVVGEDIRCQFHQYLLSSFL